MTNSVTAPLMFISHGAPTFAMEPGVLGDGDCLRQYDA